MIAARRAVDRLFAHLALQGDGEGRLAAGLFPDEGAVSPLGSPGDPFDLDQVLADVVDRLARRFDADRATVYLVDHAARELVSRAAHLPEIAEIRLRLGEGVAGWVGQRGEPIRIGERDADERWTGRIDAATGYSTRSMLCVPIRGEADAIVGVVQVLNRHGGDFTHRELRDLEQVARHLAEMLDESSLRGQLRPDADKPLSFRFNFIVGESAAMVDVYERIERAAGTDATVLLRGETGTGKELFARAVHFNSPRRGAPLVKVDCAALPESLVENELFGHERGAFTGADREAHGKVAAANGGTLFLDEIGELPLPAQGKLLRLLQDRVFVRVGGTEPRPVNVRFVCATHRDLEQMVADGKFRDDLYWRLRVVDIEVPPLRRRGHVDLDRLVDHFLYEYARRHGRDVRLSERARALIHAHPWPGNVRELEHCVESAVVLAPGPVIEADQLSLGGRRPPPELPEGAFVTAPRPLAEVERDYVRHVLALCDGSRTEAARRLGIGRNTLARKLREDG
ncbi:MAG: sigma 54-interacting transcriptional regulator [Myxococcota bacterium]